jgi:F-type H+-transporting ATPase subunit c
MPLTITEEEIAGFATLDLGREISGDSLRLSFRRRDLEPRHLGSGGWQAEAAWLEIHDIVQRAPTTVARIGPEVVSRIDELEQIEIVCDEVGSLGVVWWPAMARPPIDLESGSNIWVGGLAAPPQTPRVSPSVPNPPSPPILPPAPARPSRQPSPILPSVAKPATTTVTPPTSPSIAIPAHEPTSHLEPIVGERAESGVSSGKSLVPVFALLVFLIVGLVVGYWWFNESFYPTFSVGWMLRSFSNGLACIGTGISSIGIGMCASRLSEDQGPSRWRTLSLSALLCTFIILGLWISWALAFPPISTGTNQIAAKYIGAGIACIGLGFSAIAVALCGKAEVYHASEFTPKPLQLGMYVDTGSGLFCFLVAFLLMFVVSGGVI